MSELRAVSPGALVPVCPALLRALCGPLKSPTQCTVVKGIGICSESLGAVST